MNCCDVTVCKIVNLNQWANLGYHGTTVAVLESQDEEPSRSSVAWHSTVDTMVPTLDLFQDSCCFEQREPGMTWWYIYCILSSFCCMFFFIFLTGAKCKELVFWLHQHCWNCSWCTRSCRHRRQACHLTYWAFALPAGVERHSAMWRFAENVP